MATLPACSVLLPVLPALPSGKLATCSPCLGPSSTNYCVINRFSEVHNSVRSNFRNGTFNSKFSNFESLFSERTPRAERGRALGSTLNAVSEEKQNEVTYRNILLLIMDHNPYLCESSRQAVSTATTLAQQHKSEITVVVIDEKERDKIEDHELKVKNVRWHMAEGGFKDFKLVERIGEGKQPASILGEIADELNLDLVIFSMNLIHNKHIDANLLVEFVPCPVLLLPL